MKGLFLYFMNEPWGSQLINVMFQLFWGDGQEYGERN